MSWECEKCHVSIQGPGPFTKCPICGHYYEPASYGKQWCDCKYCRSEKKQQGEEMSQSSQCKCDLCDRIAVTKSTTKMGYIANMCTLHKALYGQG